MTDQHTRENWERTAAQPFVPANIAGVTSHHVSAEYRVAAALEYIAAQLGADQRQAVEADGGSA